MAELIIHMGTGKTGSSSIQAFLSEHHEELESESGVVVLGHADEGFYPAGAAAKVAPNHLAREFKNKPEHMLNDLVQVCQQLGNRGQKFVISAEALQYAFFPLAEGVAGCLRSYQSAIPIRLVVYIRRQDKYLRSAWAQWGFRIDELPSVYFRGLRSRLNFADNIEMLESCSQAVKLTVRYFDREFLYGGDVVEDFATKCLGIDLPGAYSPLRENQGMPANIAALLRACNDGSFWSDQHDNNHVWRIKSLVSRLGMLPDSSDKRLQNLLAALCYHWFSEQNIRTAGLLGLDHSALEIPKELDMSERDCLSELDDILVVNLADQQKELFRRLLHFALDNGAWRSGL